MKAEMTRVGVVGAGSFGSTLASLLAEKNLSVCLWAREKAIVDEVNSSRTLQKYLPGIFLSRNLLATNDLLSLIETSDVLVCAVPSQFVRSVFKNVAGALDNKIVINASKGIEQKSHLRISEVLREINSTIRYSVLSGPNFAAEMAKRLPANAVVASRDPQVARLARDLFVTPSFRVYLSTDVIGVELGGALKNVFAIATGIASGLNLGFNAQASLINRSMIEMMKMGKCLKADPKTFLGASGIGDLILTCSGPLSRNRRLGVELASGKDVMEIESKLGGIAEGAYTAESAYEIATAQGIDMPITEQVYKVLYQKKNPLDALIDLTSRQTDEEIDPSLFT